MNVVRGEMLKVKVQFFASFRETFNTKESDIELLNGTAIRDLLNELCDTFERRDALFDGDNLRHYIAILKNGRTIHYLHGLDTKLDENDTIVIFPPADGG